jgi:hypothetical protein
VRLTVLAALAAAVLVPAGPAHAAGGVTVLGAECNWTSSNDDTGTRQVGVMEAGPLVVVADDPGANPVAASIRCSLQLDTYRHSDPDVYSATSAATPGVVVLAPTPFSYEYPPDTTYISTCAEVSVVGGPTLYLDATTGAWTTDPDAPCSMPCALTYQCGDPYLIEYLVEETYAVLNATVCPILGLIPVVGHDLQVLWEDCEPWMAP